MRTVKGIRCKRQAGDVAVASLEPLLTSLSCYTGKSPLASRLNGDILTNQPSGLLLSSTVIFAVQSTLVAVVISHNQINGIGSPHHCTVKCSSDCKRQADRDATSIASSHYLPDLLQRSNRRWHPGSRSSPDM